MTPDELRERLAVLEQRVSGVEEDIRVFAPAVQELAQIRGNLIHVERHIAEVRSDVVTCRTSVDELRDALREQDRLRQQIREEELVAREKAAEVARLEKRNDRRWVIGAIISASAVIVGAMGVLAGYFG